MKFFVYLAGKMAVSKEEEAVFVDWRKEVKDILDDLLINYNQIDEVSILDPNAAEHNSMPTEKFFGRNASQINLADAILVDAREKTGIGTSQEFLIAKYYNKPVVAVSPINSYFNKIIHTSNDTVLHYIHPFLTATSDILAENFQEAVTVILDHFSGERIIRPKTIDIIEQGRQDYERNFKHLDKYMLEVVKKA